MANLYWNNKRNISLHIHPHPSEQLQTIDRYPHSLTENEGEARTGDLSALNWHNRLIHGNTHDILAVLVTEFSDSVDLIYIDPPFMTGKDFMNGTRTELAYSDKWNNDLDAYLQWLYEVFVRLHTLLACDGSLYVHLDWRVVHYAKVMLDEVFGYCAGHDGPGFKSEIIWHYRSGGRSNKSYARKHDTILLYTKSADYCFHAERIGETRGPQKRNHMRKQVDEHGHVTWTIRSAGRLYSYDEDRRMTPDDVWSDLSHLQQKDPERNGYPTQKPSALLERILLASSEVHDLVLDCFCGSGVTPHVANQLGRRWIACDQNSLAIRLTQERILAQTQVQPFLVQKIK